MIGPAAIPELAPRFLQDSRGLFERVHYGTSLTEIAQRHPEARDECVAIITRLLERAEHNDPTLNGFLVSNLSDLDASESAGVIEQAYAGEFVDDSINGTWFDVWHDLGLEGEPPPQTERLYHLVRNPEIDPPPFTQRPSNWQPAERRSPDNRKERNQTRKKLEKKGRKRKGR